MLQFLYFLIVTAIIFSVLRFSYGPSVIGQLSVSEQTWEGNVHFRLPVFALGWSLGLFFAITFVICVGFDLLFPKSAMYEVWSKLLPGFTWLSWSSLLIGLVESFLYGWYVALIFGPLFNFFANKK